MYGVKRTCLYLGEYVQNDRPARMNHTVNDRVPRLSNWRFDRVIENT